MAQTLVNTREIRIQGLISSSISRLSVSYVTLSSTSASFIRQKNASTATPSTITVTATLGDALLYNAPAYKWERSTDLAPDTWTTSGLGISSTQVITNTNFESWVGTGAQLRLRCTVSQAYRVPISTVYIVNYIKEGSDGTNGINGSNAVLADLVSESDVTFANNDGTGYSLPTGNSLRLYSGGVQITSGVTYNVGAPATVSGLTAAIDANGAITLSGASWTSNTASFTFNAVTGTSTYSAIYSIAKSRQGTAGTAGSNAIIVDLLSEADVTFANNDGTGYSLPTGNTLKLYSGGTQLTSGVTYNVSAPATVSGLTAAIDANGAITLSGASWTSNTASFTFNAVTGTSTYSAIYSIAKSRQGGSGTNGTDGSTALFAYKIITSASLPSAPGISAGLTPTAGTAVATAAASTGAGWYSTPASSLSAGEWMFQISGTRSAAGAYTWNIPSYLSTFRVGTLSALGVNTGSLTVDNTLTLGSSGKIQTNNNTGFNTTGVFLGDDGGTYKFSVGTSGSMLSWNGTTLSVPGGTITGNIPNGAIASSAITFDKLSIAIGGGNLITNSGFEIDSDNNGLADTWVDFVGGIGDVSRIQTASRTTGMSGIIGSYAYRLNVTQVGNAQDSGFVQSSIIIPALPNTKYIYTGYVRSNIANQVELLIRQYNSSTAGIGDFSSAKLAVTNTWTRLSVSFTTNANTVGLQPMVRGLTTVGWIEADGLQLEIGDVATAYAPRPQEINPGTIGTTQIADDAITTQKILAGQITAAKIATTSISSDNIASGAITASKLAVTSLSAITANMGALSVDNTLTIGNTGKIISSGTAFGGNGVFLGYDVNAYKFSVGNGNAANTLSFNGTTLTVPAAQLSGTIPGTVTPPGGWLNSNITIDTSGIINGIGTSSVQVDNKQAEFTPVLTWDFTTDSQSWSALQQVTLGYTGVGMTITATGSDPIIAVTGLSFSGQRYTKIRVRCRRLAGTGTGAIIFYSTSAGGSNHSWSGSFYKSISLPSSSFTDWSILEFDMETLTAGGTDWITNTITGLRLDLPDGSVTTSDRWEIDWIAVGNYGPVASINRYYNDQITIDVNGVLQNIGTTNTKVANSVITLGETNGVISLGNAGSGSVTTITANNPITPVNVNTYIGQTAISANYIAANAITAEKIASGAITTSKLLVTGVGATLTEDPNTQDFGAWAGLNTATIVSDSDSPTGYALNIPNTNTITVYTDKMIPIDTSRNYLARMSVKQQSGTSTCYLTIFFLDSTGANIVGSDNNTGWASAGTYFYFGVTGGVPSSSWQTYQIAFGPGEVAKIPAQAKFIRLGFLANHNGGTGVQRFTNIRLIEKSNADLIVDGTIVASKLATGSVEADKIAANTITTGKLLVTGRGAALNEDPGCQDQSAWTGWQVNPVATVTAITDGRVGNSVLRASSSTRSISSKLIPCDPGKTYRLSAWVRKSSTSNGLLYLRTVDYGPSETLPSQGVERSFWASGTGGEGVSPPTANTWYNYSIQFTVPSGRTAFTPHILLAWGGSAGYMEAQDVRIEEAVPASLIVDGTIVASKLATNSVESEKIAANAITATKIAAGTITTEKLLVTPSNLVANSEFATGDASNWRLWATPANQSVVASSSNGPSGAPSQYIMRFTPGSNVATFAGSSAYSDVNASLSGFGVEPAAQYFVSIWAAGSGDYAGSSVRVIAYFYKADGTFTTSIDPVILITPTTSWANYSGNFTAPAGTVRCWLYVYSNFSAGNLYWTKLYCVRRASANLIVDGAITTDKLDANAVTAGKIAAGSITASKLVLVNPGSSLLPDSSFEDQSSWAATYGGALALFKTVTDSPSGRYVAYIAAGTSGRSLQWFPGSGTQCIPIDRNKSYRLSWYMRSPSGATTGSASYATLQERDSAGDTIGANAGHNFYLWSGTISHSAWQRYEYVIGAGGQAFSATTRYVCPSFLFNWENAGAELQIADVRLVERADASLIVDGAITASKLTVTSLSAITANMGALTVNNTLTIGNTGKIISTGATYNSSGIFLGYDSTAYKFSIGNGTNNLTFDGTTLTVPAARLSGTAPATGLTVPWATVAGTTNAPENNANNTYVDGNGLIQGVSQNSGTAVRNTLVNVDVNGILQGIGTASIQVNNDFQILGSNLVPNSDQTHRVSWSIGYNPNGATLESSRVLHGYVVDGWNTTNYALQLGTLRNVWVCQTNRHTGTVDGETDGFGNTLAFDVLYDDNVPVVPGQRICFSVYGGSHRCRWKAFIAAINAAGSTVEYATGAVQNSTEASANSLDLYNRSFGFYTVPAGVHQIKLFVRKYNTFSGQNNSYLWIAAPQIEVVKSASITTPSTYRPGLPYRADQLGSNTIRFKNVAFCEQVGDTIQKIGGTNNSWDAGMISAEGYSGGCKAVSVCGPDSGYVQAMFGLNATQDSVSFSDIDYAIYLDLGNYKVYESGALIGTYGSYVENDVFSVVYDGTNIQYIKNGTVFLQKGVIIPYTMYLDTALYGLNDKLYGLSFSPLSKITARNLLDSRTWRYNTTGAQPGFSLNGTTGTNGADYIAVGSLPDGREGIFWRARSGAGGANQGGWNGEDFPIDPTKMYRFSVWIRCFKPGGGTSGDYYFGCKADTVAKLEAGDPTQTNNPYFISGQRNTLQDSTWHLIVGYIYPSSYTGIQYQRSGTYRGTDGLKVANGWDFKWASSSINVSMHRAYQFYTTANSTGENNYQDFWDPRVEIMDGTEPSLAELLAVGSVSGRNPVTTSNVGQYVGNGAISADYIAANAITAAKISAGSVLATAIAAGAITTDKLVVTGRGKCINDDPTFLDNSAWTSDAGSFVLVNESTAPVGTRVLRATDGTRIYARQTAIEAGKYYKVSMWHRQVSGSGTIYIRLYCYNYAGSLINYIVTGLTPTTNNFEGLTPTAGWTKYTGYIVAGAAVVRGTLIIHTNWSTTGVSEIADARVEEYIGGDLIVDGAIVAAKLAANSVEAGKIAAGAITASKIVVSNQDSVFPDPGWYDRTWWAKTTNGYSIPATNLVFANESSTWPVRRILQFSGNIGTFDFSTESFPIELGASYRYKVTIYKASNFAGRWAVHAHFPEQAWFAMGIPRSATVTTTASLLYALDMAAIPTDAWASYTSVYTNSASLLSGSNPNTVQQFRFSGVQTAGDMHIAIEMVRANGSDLIVDGAIVADKISANAVTAPKINITGGATNTGRIVINTNQILIYDDGNANRVKIGLL